jgi:nicotinate phosphoribosyltransferase
MLKKRLSGGKRTEPKTAPGEEIQTAHNIMETQLATFDASFRRMLNPHIYKVSISKELKDLKLRFIEAGLNMDFYSRGY